MPELSSPTSPTSSSELRAQADAMRKEVEALEKEEKELRSSISGLKHEERTLKAVMAIVEKGKQGKGE